MDPNNKRHAYLVFERIAFTKEDLKSQEIHPPFTLAHPPEQHMNQRM